MRTRHVLLALTLVAGGAGLAVAQTTSLFDPAQLPAFHGRVAEYSLTPRGDVDGLLLADGTEIHTPPHLGTRIVAIIKPGDTVTVHGLKARALPVVQAMSVANDATQAVVVDDGPPDGRRLRHDDGPVMTAQGIVKAQLHGPRGELNGVLLQDGTIVHLPPDQARRLSAELAVGDHVFASGDGYDGPLGHVVGARAIGPDAGQVVEIVGTRPPGGPGPDGPAGDRDAPPLPGFGAGPGAPPPPPGGPHAPPPGGLGAPPSPKQL